MLVSRTDTPIHNLSFVSDCCIPILFPNSVVHISISKGGRANRDRCAKNLLLPCILAKERILDPGSYHKHAPKTYVCAKNVLDDLWPVCPLVLSDVATEIVETTEGIRRGNDL